MKIAGEVVADLKRQELAKIDVDLLNLKRTVLAEKFEDFKSDLNAAVKEEKARAHQDLVSRGLGNSTGVENSRRRIERDASNEFYKVSREYNPTMEEIALFERKVNEQARPWWKKALGWWR